jgi:hypothetical protein
LAPLELQLQEQLAQLQQQLLHCKTKKNLNSQQIINESLKNLFKRHMNNQYTIFRFLSIQQLIIIKPHKLVKRKMDQIAKKGEMLTQLISSL